MYIYIYMYTFLIEALYFCICIKFLTYANSTLCVPYINEGQITANATKLGDSKLDTWSICYQNWASYVLHFRRVLFKINLLHKCFYFFCSLLMPYWTSLCVLRRTCRQSSLNGTLFHYNSLSKPHHHISTASSAKYEWEYSIMSYFAVCS
jgi:hypothetical protein